MTIDHIMPKALGGSKGSWTNRTGACFECNQAKAHTPLLFFLLELSGQELSHLKDEDGRWPLPDEGIMEALEDHEIPLPEPVTPNLNYWNGKKAA